jgi:hypothetical protein
VDLKERVFAVSGLPNYEEQRKDIEDLLLTAASFAAHLLLGSFANSLSITPTCSEQIAVV